MYAFFMHVVVAIIFILLSLQIIRMSAEFFLSGSIAGGLWSGALAFFIFLLEGHIQKYIRKKSEILYKCLQAITILIILSSFLIWIRNDAFMRSGPYQASGNVHYYEIGFNGLPVEYPTDNIANVVLGESISLSDSEKGPSLTLTSVTTDNRCPEGKDCESAGEVSINVSIVDPAFPDATISETLTILGKVPYTLPNSSNALRLGNTLIVFFRLDPFPALSNSNPFDIPPTAWFFISDASRAPDLAPLIEKEVQF